jgi:hypothetical protein
MAAFSSKDEMFSALAVAILLIGTATGSAIAIFVMSTITLSLMAVFYRKQPSGGHLLAAGVAAITAIAVGLIMSVRKSIPSFP